MQENNYSLEKNEKVSIPYLNVTLILVSLYHTHRVEPA